jgi:two-component system CitB family sensor kinase
VKVFLTDIGDDIILEVEDHGTGIAEEIGNHIFEVGYSTKGTSNRGYGLHLVKKAVNKLYGFISFTSELNKGTVFTVVIPKRKVE